MSNTGSRHLASRFLLGCGSVLATTILQLSAAPVHHWVDTGAGFRAGTLGNSGQNLYVNPRGELETIRHFDVDGDGNLDIVSNSGHDYAYNLPAVLATLSRGSTLDLEHLEIDGSSRVIPADLNKDGFTDLLFLPNRQNIQDDRRSNLTIVWGGSDGWSKSRLTRQLPVYGAFAAESGLIPDARVAVGDINHDGWPDIVTLNDKRWMPDQPDGRILRVYWGGSGGFLLTNYTDCGIPDAIEIAVGKFIERADDSIAVLTSTGNISYLSAEEGSKSLTLKSKLHFPAAPGWVGKFHTRCCCVQAGEGAETDSIWIGTDTDAVIRVGGTTGSVGVSFVRACPATHITLSRLDDDAYPDLVLTDFHENYRAGEVSMDSRGTVTVLWGSPDGFTIGRSTHLGIPNAIATAVGDLNADGKGDLAVSVFRGDKTMQASSLIYLGNGTRDLTAKPMRVLAEGAQDVAVTKLDTQANPTVIFADSCHYTLDALVPTRIFWGAANGFSRDRMTEVPNLAGLKASLSDLNADGYPDLILVRGGDVGSQALLQAPDIGANIYWGGPQGRIGNLGPDHFDQNRRQVLPVPQLCAINVADLNKDGYLDVVLGQYEPLGGGDHATNLVIYYGSAQGFLPSNRKQLRLAGRGESCLIADFDRDGWLDIAVTHLWDNMIVIYRGGSEGFSNDIKIVIPYVTPCGLDAADLNNDGWLDLMVGSYSDPIAQRRDTGMSILWGGSSGYRQSNSQWLPALSPDSIKAADLDGDGYLDIIAPNYHGEYNREDMPSYIYWGSAKGYSTSERTSLTVNSACDVMVGDFNQDGKLDLAFNAHSVNSGHLLDSPIYYNDCHRFKSPKVQYVPVVGPFYMWIQDIGNIYNRRYVETFESRVFSWTDDCSDGELSMEANLPHGADVVVQIRSASDVKRLRTAEWRTIDGNDFNTLRDDRVLQYRLLLSSSNGDSYPIVNKVNIALKYNFLYHRKESENNNSNQP